MANLLKGKVVSDQIISECIDKISKLKEKNIIPTLALFKVGNNDSDSSYEKGIIKRCEQVGIEIKNYYFEKDVDPCEFYKSLGFANNDQNIHSILVFRPLPSQFKDDELRNYINPNKDVDGCCDTSLGSIFINNNKGYSPCTAQAVIELLNYYDIDVSNKNIVVLGRSLVIGKPVSMMLLNKNATVTICHSKTKDIASITKNADIVIAAIGKMESLNASYFSSHQTVVDVGIHYNSDKQKLCGDVLFDEVEPIVENITPVPGGVGSITTSILVKHIVDACINVN